MLASSVLDSYGRKIAFSYGFNETKESFGSKPSTFLISSSSSVRGCIPGSLHCTVHKEIRVRRPITKSKIVNQIQLGQRYTRINPFIDKITIRPIVAILGLKDVLLGPNKQHPKQVVVDLLDLSSYSAGFCTYYSCSNSIGSEFICGSFCYCFNVGLLLMATSMGEDSNASGNSSTTPLIDTTFSCSDSDGSSGVS